MSQAQMLRKHHRGLAEMAGELEKALLAPAAPNRNQAVILVLSRMSGLLALHLALEDKVMYPRLQAQGSYAVVEMSRRFFEEVGGLKAAFEAYRRKWMRPAVIETAWEDFTIETRSILKALRERIAREDGEIYQVVEKLGI